MSVKYYQYPRCGTCRKATKWLQEKGISVESIDITEHPPGKDELNEMLGYVDGNIRKLFNTSGIQYRELKIKDRLPTMSNAEAIDLLAGNGKLIKRPFVLTANGGTVGFKEADWEKLFGV